MVFLKIFGRFILWLVLTALLASLLRIYEIKNFDCSVRGQWFLDFFLVGTLSGGTFLVAGVLSSKNRLPAAKVAMVVPCVVGMLALAAIVGLVWFLSHMCP
jgi:hypothetical protein